MHTPELVPIVNPPTTKDTRIFSGIESWQLTMLRRFIPNSSEKGQGLDQQGLSPIEFKYMAHELEKVQNEIFQAKTRFLKHQSFANQNKALHIHPAFHASNVKLTTELRRKSGQGGVGFNTK